MRDVRFLPGRSLSLGLRKFSKRNRPNNEIHRTPARWHAECLVATLPALAAPAVRCR